MISEYIIHHWRIDCRSASLIHEVTGEHRRLGEYQFKLLMVLVQHVGVILTHKELNTLVWESRNIGHNSLPNAIHALRVALEDDGKQQRIIKTIPRKGYILESEFCTFRPQREPCQDQLDLVSAIPTDLEQDEYPASQSVDAPLLFKWHNHPGVKIVIVQYAIMGLILIILALSRQAPASNSLLELDAGIFSNIQLFELHRHSQRLNPPENLLPVLIQPLCDLNQILKNRQVRMEIFFFTSDSKINYTLLLISHCDRRQLAMNIAQWHTNSTQFNTLIYRETEKELNEMATCIP